MHGKVAEGERFNGILPSAGDCRVATRETRSGAVRTTNVANNLQEEFLGKLLHVTGICFSGLDSSGKKFSKRKICTPYRRARGRPAGERHNRVELVQTLSPGAVG